jgi:hypothetical protein
MKILIAVLSCQRDRGLGCHNHARLTYGKDLADFADLRFFVGGPEPSNLAEDEVWVDAVDDYVSLPAKTKAICQYMLRQDYDFVFKADNDTYLIPQDFRGFMQNCRADVAGSLQGSMEGRPAGKKFGMVISARPPSFYPWGGGYLLSRKAAKLVVDFEHPGVGPEDRMVGAAVIGHKKDLVFETYSGFLATGGHGGVPHGPCLPPR